MSACRLNYIAGISMPGLSLPSLFPWLHLRLKAVLLALFGLMSAAAIPLWQLYFVDVAEIDLELVSIERITSDKFKVTLDTDELMLLEPYITEQELYEYDERGVRGDKIHYPEFPLSTLTNAFNKARVHLKNISATKLTLTKYIKQIDGYLSPTDLRYSLVEFRISQLKLWDLSSYIDDAEAAYYQEQLLALTRDYSQLSFDQQGEPLINFASLRFLLIDVREDIVDVMNENDRRLEILRDNIRSIENQLQQMGEQQLSNHTYFRVEAVASNSGRGSTSLRPVALLRLEIGRDNYVDIPLRMEKTKRQAELQPGSNQVIYYYSVDLDSFPDQDQGLLNTFWGSTGQVRLFNIDTEHRVYTSNQIAFAGNLNQKLILNKLKQVAAKSDG